MMKVEVDGVWYVYRREFRHMRSFEIRQRSWSKVGANFRNFREKCAEQSQGAQQIFKF